MLSTIGLLVPVLFCPAQSRHPEQTTATGSSTISSRDIEQLPFARGNWEYQIRQNAEYSYMKNSESGQSLGHQNSLGFNLGANYFVADHIGVGLELNTKWTGNHYLSDNTTSKWMGWADVMYGLPLSPDIDFYGKLSVGLGTEKATYKSGSTSSSTTDNLFGYRIGVGAPIRLFDKGPLFVTPELSWDYLHTSFDGGHENDNGLRLGLCLEAYMGCNQFSCDCHHGFSLSHNVYQPGTSFIDFSTHGGFDFGTLKTTYTGSSSVQEESHSREMLDAGYSIYVLPNFAVGGSIAVGGTSEKDKNSSAKVTTGNWMITPMLEFNLPVDNGWNNSFLKLGVGFGSEKSTSGSGSNSSSVTDNIFSYYALVGYNDFIARRLAFVPRIGYECNTFKNTSTDVKEKSNGIEVELGLRLFLGQKWKY